MQKIILVEDDSDIRFMLEEYLSTEGFEIKSFENGAAFGSEIHNYDEYSIALIDLMLPDVNGMELVKRIRKTSNLPIIIITAKDTDTDKTLGFGLGADDYVVKPFSLIELTARIKANIRRAQISGACDKKELVYLRDLTIDRSRYSVVKSGKSLELTRTEFDILYLLATHPGQTFSKEQLYEAIWKEPYYGDENAINSHMNRLRTKLKAGGARENYIKTLWGIGYRVEKSE